METEVTEVTQVTQVDAVRRPPSAIEKVAPLSTVDSVTLARAHKSQVRVPSISPYSSALYVYSVALWLCDSVTLWHLACGAAIAQNH